MVMRLRVPGWLRVSAALTLPVSASTFGNVTTTCAPTYGTLPGVAHPPRPATLLWPDPQAGPWAVTVFWRVQYGVPIPVGMDVRAWGALGLPAEGADLAFPRMEGTVLRALPMTELLERSREQVQQQLDADSSGRPTPADRAVKQGENRSRMQELQALLEDEPGDPGNAFRWAELKLLQRQEHDGPRIADADERRRLDLEEQLAAFRGSRGTRDLGDDHYREVAAVYAKALRELRPPTQAVADYFNIQKSGAAKKVSRARQRGFLPKTTRGRIGPLTEDL